MPTATVSKAQVLAALTAAGRAHQGQPSMDELAAAAGVSRATLYRLFGSQHNLLQALGLAPPPSVRSRILDVALDLVGRHGLAELSMDELATAAGVSRATLYRLFPGKTALFAELVRRFSPFEPIAAVLQTRGDQPPAEVIPAVAQAMASAMDGRMGLLLQLLFEFTHDRDTSRDAVSGMRTLPLVARYLAGQMAAGNLRRMDPTLAFQALVGPIVLHLLWRSPGPATVSLPQVVDEFARAWLRAMAPDPQSSAGPAQPGRNHHGPDTDPTPAGRP